MDAHKDFFETLPPSLKEAMQEFDKAYLECLSSRSQKVMRAVGLISSSSGKRLRPLIMMLTASSLGELSSRVVSGALFIELLHTATLVHDDIIDGSDLRRGRPSLNAQIGIHEAVLFGDYLLTTAMMLAVQSANLRVLERLMSLGRSLSEGEFLQMDASGRSYPSREEYFEIIRYKTASLISSSVEIGALLAGCHETERLEALARAGEALGLAFQIKDDIFDYTSKDTTIGKRAGSDLREHKVTLPLLYALTTSSPDTPRALALLDSPSLQEDEVDFLIDFAIKQGGVSHAEEVMRGLIEESKRAFVELLPPSPSRGTLLDLCDYVGSRNK